ncbi:flavin-containing monooxygenase [Pararobbsia alpina]|uniref:Ferredoxin--NADP reductase n=1 Tax=Pararobbsia alpina TaxID=621374 RepID=A0A6S7BC64_9BURK|nr:NAD(P)/FAD-dependent oxidoreductase [Pararobbsia alpina]CAB3793315.1 Ferredoxin--NADP reductase [Pararobbsia alpina]
MDHVTDTLVIGAGPAGLAVAACLKKRDVPFLVVDRAATIGSSWRRHYDRLHLHTDRSHSALPYLPFPKGTPRYPSREHVIGYLEQYARHFQLAPHFGEEVQALRVVEQGWAATTSAGVYRSPRVVVASGYNAVPHEPRWPGQERFGGHIMHSSAYRNGEPFRGQRVLVIGFGNSGGEIAVDLHEHGAQVAVAVRGPVNIIPRDILGIPVLSVGIALSRLPTRVSDALAAPFVRLIMGDITRLGFRKLAMGPLAQIRNTARVPLIDVGTIKLIREGYIEVVGDVREMSVTGVTFDDGRSLHFDAIVVATGFRPRTDAFLEAQDDVSGMWRAGTSGVMGTGQGLYFCGFIVSPTGMLREIGIEAQRIAEDIARTRH